ncbi:MAG: hypothetical protein ACUVR8_10155 [Acidobacteriota bacterium]
MNLRYALLAFSLLALGGGVAAGAQSGVWVLSERQVQKPNEPKPGSACRVTYDTGDQGLSFTQVCSTVDKKRITTQRCHYSWRSTGGLSSLLPGEKIDFTATLNNTGSVGFCTGYIQLGEPGVVVADATVNPGGSLVRQGSLKIPDKLVNPRTNKTNPLPLVFYLHGGNDTSRVVLRFWYQWRETAYNPAAPTPARDKPPPVPQTPDARLPAAGDPLGRIWEEAEGEWKGVWTRRGNSNVFDAAYTGPGGVRFDDVLTMTLDGNKVTIRRQKLPNFIYEGTIDASGTVSGSSFDGAARGNWKAVIRHERLPAAGDPLGRIWEEAEGEWKGVWTRRGNSNVFDAAYTGPGGVRFDDVLTMTLDGNKVTIRRQKLPNFIYEGTIDASGTVSGSSFDGAARGNWKAVIRR